MFDVQAMLKPDLNANLPAFNNRTSAEKLAKNGFAEKLQKADHELNNAKNGIPIQEQSIKFDKDLLEEKQLNEANGIFYNSYSQENKLDVENNIQIAVIDNEIRGHVTEFIENETVSQNVVIDSSELKTGNMPTVDIKAKNSDIICVDVKNVINQEEQVSDVDNAAHSEKTTGKTGPLSMKDILIGITDENITAKEKQPRASADHVKVLEKAESSKVQQQNMKVPEDSNKDKIVLNEEKVQIGSKSKESLEKAESSKVQQQNMKVAEDNNKDKIVLDEEKAQIGSKFKESLEKAESSKVQQQNMKVAEDSNKDKIVLDKEKAQIGSKSKESLEKAENSKVQQQNMKVAEDNNKGETVLDEKKLLDKTTVVNIIRDQAKNEATAVKDVNARVKVRQFREGTVLNNINGNNSIETKQKSTNKMNRADSKAEIEEVYNQKNDKQEKNDVSKIIKYESYNTNKQKFTDLDSEHENKTLLKNTEEKVDTEVVKNHTVFGKGTELLSKSELSSAKNIVETGAKNMPDPEELIEQVVKKVELIRKEDLSEMKIQLKPEFLGKMLIKVSVEDGVVTARFITESHHAKHILEGNLHLLKQNLEASGLKVEKTEVNVQIDNSGSFQDSGREAQQMWQHYSGGNGKKDAFTRSDEGLISEYKMDNVEDLEVEQVSEGIYNDGKLNFLI